MGYEDPHALPDVTVSGALAVDLLEVLAYAIAAVDVLAAPFPRERLREMRRTLRSAIREQAAD